jgi:hypothetical protein
MTAGVPAAYQPMVDWVTQPVPSFRGDMHALHFFLINEEGEAPFPLYQGFMFFNEVPNPSHTRHHSFSGVGRVVGNRGYLKHAQTFEPGGVSSPSDWVKLHILLRHAPHAPGFGASFHKPGSDAFVGELASSLEYDLPLTDFAGGTGWFFRLEHSETHALEWEFNVQQTNLQFQPTNLT